VTPHAADTEAADLDSGAFYEFNITTSGGVQSVAIAMRAGVELCLRFCRVLLLSQQQRQQHSSSITANQAHLQQAASP
jgi:hypothetical protein